MRTTVSLDPEAYRLARALAAKQRRGIGKVLGDALLSQFQNTHPTSKVEIDEHGFPVMYIGRPITPGEVASAVEEE